MCLNNKRTQCRVWCSSKLLEIACDVGGHESLVDNTTMDDIDRHAVEVTRQDLWIHLRHGRCLYCQSIEAGLEAIATVQVLYCHLCRLCSFKRAAEGDACKGWLHSHLIRRMVAQDREKELAS